ncbi:MAG: RHS repeat protein [Aquincola sp.]|nr:RHS repeat protein [Aquincola sp.]
MTTNYTYDARQRLISSSTAGETTVYEYWPTGLLRRVTQPDGSFQAYGYDDAHRLVSVTDNLGNSVTYTLDNLGNRTTEEVKDPGNVLRRALARSIDALGRVQQVTGRE